MHLANLANYLFHGQYKTLYHRDASMLADSTIARWLDTFAFYPLSKCGAIEDLLAVTNNVFR